MAQKETHDLINLKPDAIKGINLARQLMLPATDQKALQLPVIFLDEFNISPSSNELERSQFKFWRNIIKAYRLVPVKMGTNSSISNLVSAQSGMGIAMSHWCFVFYQLPSYSENLFPEKLAECLPGKHQLQQLIKHPLKSKSIFRRTLTNSSLNPIDWHLIASILSFIESQRIFSSELQQARRILCAMTQIVISTHLTKLRFPGWL